MRKEDGHLVCSQAKAAGGSALFAICALWVLSIRYIWEEGILTERMFP